MNKKIRNQNQGFTIIEVLIVLAIAGLIMLIVFLAVPALQRNARNTARKNDVGRLGAAVTEYGTNNNGSVPTQVTQVTTYAGALAQYDVENGSFASGAQGALANVSNFTIVTGAKCGSGGTTVAGSSRQVAIQYMAETSGSPAALCQDV